MNDKQTNVSLFTAFVPIILLIALLTLNVIIWQDATLDGANQLALFFSAALASVIAIYKGVKWTDIRSRIVSTISDAMPSIIILLLIGSLSGTWLIGGIVPALVYYGLDILQPRIFLFATVIICAIVSLATGSSWSTIATLGIALIGIGTTIGISKPLVAGAIISGAYFGDKISPLSDTTNLAPAMAGTDLFTHVKYMLYTTVPTLIITLLIFLFMGFTLDLQDSTNDVNAVQTAIKNTFFISPILFIVPILLIIIIVKKTPPIPSLLIGTLLGAILSLIFQEDVIQQLSAGGEISFMNSYKIMMQAMYGNISVTTGNINVDSLFSTSGMSGMLNTVWLILAAMIFGGTMDAGGMLSKISSSILKVAKTTTSLIISTAFSCIFFNITASDQYISLVVPGKMYADIYKQQGLAPEVLSRTLEDSGTVTSVLIPWNTCGATQSGILGVSTLSYLPYCFFNIISPFMTMLFAVLKIKIRKIK